LFWVKTNNSVYKAIAKWVQDIMHDPPSDLLKQVQELLENQELRYVTGNNQEIIFEMLDILCFSQSLLSRVVGFKWVP
jgi:hypothetical protein